MRNIVDSELTDLQRPARWLTFAVTIIVAAQLIAAAILPKSISWDPSYGMLAAQHYVHGRSPDLLHIAEANRDDLTKDKLVERGYWAPGYQVVPWLLRMGVFSWGTSLKLTIILGLLAGLCGWGMYFHRMLGSRRDAMWLLLALLCARYTWLFTIVYAGGDLLLWSVAPWIVLLNAAALTKNRTSDSVFAGGCAMAVFLVKYSGIFTAVGLGVAWGLAALRREISWNRFVGWAAGAGAVGIVIKLLGFPANGHAAGARELMPREALLSLGLSSAGPTDLDAVITRLADTLHMGGGEWMPAAVGFGVLVFVVGMCWSKRGARADGANARAVARMGTTAAVTDMVGLATLVFIGGNIALQARLGRIAGLLLLPLLVHCLRRFEGAQRWRKYVLIGILFVLPGVYGVAAGGSNLLQGWQRRKTSTGTDGVACFPLSPATAHDAFFHEVNARLPGADTVLVVPQAQLLFPIPRRRCIVFDGVAVLNPEAIAWERWRGVPDGGVALLLPRTYDGDARLGALQSVFVDLHRWRMVPLDTDPQWALWISG